MCGCLNVSITRLIRLKHKVSLAPHVDCAVWIWNILNNSILRTNLARHLNSVCNHLLQKLKVPARIAPPRNPMHMLTTNLTTQADWRRIQAEKRQAEHRLHQSVRRCLALWRRPCVWTADRRVHTFDISGGAPSNRIAASTDVPNGSGGDGCLGSQIYTVQS